MPAPAFFPLPVTRVEVELTEACNLRCAFCYNSCAPRESRDPEGILHRLADAGVMELIFTGGEPALHSRFPALLKLAGSLFARVMVQSNGTLFATAQALDVLRQNAVFCVNFSLHGPEAVHDALVGRPGSFAETRAALEHAVRAGIRAASNLVLNSRNARPDVLRETVDILAATGCEEMTITRFIPTGLGKDKPLQLGADAFISALRVLVEATDSRGIALLLANSAPACQLPQDLQHLCNRCSFGHDKFYIDVQGQVMVCGMGRHVLGNLLETPLCDVLHGADLYARYRTLAHLPEKCRACPMLEDCGGGCRAAAFARANEIDAEDVLLG
ncbi:radical SAM superfamily protein [Desulfovibrio sp. A2]|nr:radical SAM superfamily protein [Desulfovibrio sp. A2]